MRITLLNRMATPQGNYSPGSVVEVDDARGKDLIARGYAELAPEGAELVTFQLTEPLPAVRAETATQPEAEFASVVRVEGSGRKPKPSKEARLPEPKTTPEFVEEYHKSRENLVKPADVEVKPDPLAKPADRK